MGRSIRQAWRCDVTTLHQPEVNGIPWRHVGILDTVNETDVCLASVTHLLRCRWSDEHWGSLVTPRDCRRRHAVVGDSSLPHVNQATVNLDLITSSENQGQ